MSDFERYTVKRLLRQAEEAGLDVSGFDVSGMCHTAGTWPAGEWARLHPDDDGSGCCWGDIIRGPAHCNCWEPVYDVDQQPPQPPQGPHDLKVQDGLCHDCAFRPGSPERADEFAAEALYELARTGEPFWCHQGMRRPVKWLHPDGREVEGSPDDWAPAKQGGIPYRADGRPGLLCAGWAAVGAHDAGSAVA